MIQIRARKADVRLFDDAAKAMGITRSELLRSVAVERARIVLANFKTATP